MYHVHTTEALVLSERGRGEASKILFLFTKHLGVVFARATGIRKLDSKLRYSLQKFSHATVSLVRGRGEWKIIDAQALESFPKILGSEADRLFLSRMAVLLERFLSESTDTAQVFEITRDALLFLERNNLSPSELHQLEIYLVASLLFHLGHMPEVFPLEFSQWEARGLLSDVIKSLSGHELRLVGLINEALSASHLAGEHMV